jgi:hypothetical protein
MMAIISPFSNEVNTALIALAIVVVILAMVFAVFDLSKVEKIRKRDDNKKLPLIPATKPAVQLEAAVPVKSTIPTFNASELNISPVEAKEGEPITIAFRIVNTSSDSGCYKAIVQLDNRIVAEEVVDLGPGEINQMTCSVIGNQAGEHEVKVGDLTAKFVIPNADISITSLDINPRQAKAGEPVTVKAELTNKGGATGINRLEISVDGEVVTTKEISVAPGKTELMTFEITETKAGEHLVEVGGLTVTFVVPEADIKISALDISPLKVKAGETVIVSAMLTNKGGITGTKTLELNKDGKIVATKEVTVAPEKTELITFETVEETSGEHQVKIDDLTATFLIGKADIIITALNVNPQLVRAGETVTVRVELLNSGNIIDRYNLELLLDGKVAVIKEVTVSPEKPELLIFEVAGTKAGEHKVEAGNFVCTFVIPEADIKINSHDIIPRRAKVGELVVVKVELINKGGVTGNKKLELKLGDTFITSQEFAIAPGISQKAIFYLRSIKPGTHRITINDIGDEFTVYMENNP